MKTIISASVDSEPLLDCKEQHLNISSIVNQAIWEHSRIDRNVKLDILKAEAKRIEDTQLKIQADRKIEQLRQLSEFDKLKCDLSDPINEHMIDYWIKKTGLTREQLLERNKRGCNGSKEQE